MAVGYNPKIITDGLSICLDAANPKSYPGSGTTWFDISGNSINHILYSSSRTTVDSVLCFDVAASGRYIANPTTSFTYPSSHTVISWARPLADSQVSTWRTLWRTTPNDHLLLIQDSTNTIGYYDNDSNQFVSYGLNAGTLAIENKWTMFSLVSNGSTTTLYVNNGSSSGSVNYTISGMSQDAIGSTDGGSQAFGYVATAMVYNRALTISEIKQNFNALRGRFGI